MRPGPLLASVLYAPATDITFTYTVDGASQSVDPTNLTIAFTVPASGKVTMLASYDYSIGATLPSLFTGWFGHGSSVQPPGYQWRFLSSNSPPTFNGTFWHSGLWNLTGLAPRPLQLDFASLYGG